MGNLAAGLHLEPREVDTSWELYQQCLELRDRYGFTGIADGCREAFAALAS